MKSRLFNIPPLPAVILSIISVQCGATIAKKLFPLMGAAGTASLRIGISAIILCIAFRPNLKKISLIQWKWVSLYGFALGAMNMVFYLAIEKIPVGLGVTLEFVGPLLLAVMGSKRITDFLWVLLAAAGLALIAPLTNSGINPYGILLALLAGGFWAAYIVLGGKISKIMNTGEAVSIGMLFATILILPFGIFSGNLNHINTKLFAFGTALALLSSAIPFTLEMKALRQLSSKTFSILMSLEPAVASICALIFLQEYLSLKECFAVACVVIASAGATLTSKRSNEH